MLKIDFLIAGKKIEAGNYEDATRGFVLYNLREALEEKVKSIKCPVHKTSAHFTVEGKDFENMKITFNTCCNTMKDLIGSKFTE
jgi:hypothetical protein